MTVKHLIRFVIPFALLLLLTFSSGAQNSELTVFYNLSGELKTVNNIELAVTFSHDMVALGQEREGKEILQISPVPEGQFLWRGTKTLVFKPKNRFLYSTRYRVSIPAGTRAMNGQIIKQTKSWSFITPLPYPIRVKMEKLRYPRSIQGYKKKPPNSRYYVLGDHWVTTPFFLVFDQPVPAGEFKKYLTVRNENTGTKAAVNVSQKNQHTLKITPAAPFKRGTGYEFHLKKGFMGSEGNRGTTDDFFFYMSTVQPFRFSRLHTRSICSDDSPKIWMVFTNDLKKDQPENIKVFKLTANGDIELEEIEIHYGHTLGIGIGDTLNQGDELLVKIGKETANIYGEKLGKDHRFSIPVCSRPRMVAFDPKAGVKEFRVGGMQSLQLKFYTFHDSLFQHLDRGKPRGSFASGRKGSQYIDRTFSKRFHFDSDKPQLVSVHPSLEGIPYGLWGVMVERAEPFNICKNDYQWSYWGFNSPGLHIFHNRSIDFVYRGTGKDAVIWAYQRNSGDILAQATLSVKAGGDFMELGRTGADGVLLLPSKNTFQYNSLLKATNPADGSDKAFLRVKDTGTRSESPYYQARLFCERHYYQPGDTVYIGGVVKKIGIKGIETDSPGTGNSIEYIRLTITGPGGTTAAQAHLEIDPFGGFQYRFDSPKDIKKGLYSISAYYKNRLLGYENITIDYFQPNTIDISIFGLKPYYTVNDTFDPEVTGKYLAGNPMAGDELEYRLEPGPPVSLQQVLRTSENILDNFSFSLYDKFKVNLLPLKGSARFDTRGTYRFQLPFSRFKETNNIAGFSFEVVGKTGEGKEFKANARRVFLPGNRVTGIKLPGYVSAQKPVTAELAMLNSKGEPVSGTTLITLYKEKYHKNKGWQYSALETFKDVNIDGRGEFQVNLPDPGFYILRCDTPDEQNRIISTSRQFYAWSSSYSQSQTLKLTPEKETCHTGDTIKLFINSPKKGKGLVTIEKDGILKHFVIGLDKTTVFETPVLEEYFPSVRVNVVALFPGNLTEESSTTINVESQKHRLKVDIDGPAELAPGSNGRVKFRVTGSGNKGEKARIFVYAVDEGHLSISNYYTPDLHYTFYLYHLRGHLSHTISRSYFSRHRAPWFYKDPYLDIPLGDDGVFGRVTTTGGSPLEGVTVTLKNEDKETIATSRTSPQGYYFIPAPLPEKPAVDFELEGYRQLDVFPPFSAGSLSFSKNGLNRHNKVMLTEAQYSAFLAAPAKNWQRGFGFDFGVEGGVVGGILGAPGSADSFSGMAAIQLRSDFKPVLFFKLLETDENGEALLDFKTSDLLTTYRVTAVAYTDTCFGSGTDRFSVTKDLLMKETMPEFARRGDSFEAGVLLSNRKKKNMTVNVLAKPEGLTIDGNAGRQVQIARQGNLPVDFRFNAPYPGETKIRFFARSKDKKTEDGLLKTLPVLETLVKETLLDFDSGKTINKKVMPQSNAVSQSIKLKVTPSILRPAVKIAEKLVFYPYECLEQRTSKAMPYLALSDEFIQRLELPITREQVRESIAELIAEIPEFMSTNGGLAYYKKGRYYSDYLTLYVLRFLQRAEQKGFDVPPLLPAQLKGFLISRQNQFHGDMACLYQYVLSLDGSASSKVLLDWYHKRETLSLVGQAYLYKALSRKFPGSGLVKPMAESFNRRLQVEADFAYFEAQRPAGYPQWYLPFFSNRYVTALLLQTFLEVDGGHPLASRIMNWLLETPPYCWNTTQTNFRILHAMDLYMHKVEGAGPRTAVARLMDMKKEKTLSRYKDTLVLEKALDKETVRQAQPVDISVTADKPVYLTTELQMQLDKPGAKSRGVKVTQNVYDEMGQPAIGFKKGGIYQVELLIEADKDVPYAVIDAPLAAGFEIMRQDVSTTRMLLEYNMENRNKYFTPWSRAEHAPDRVVFYTYRIGQKTRIVYFIKAIYKGEFTWLSTVVQGMYHPQYFGRTGTLKVKIE